MNITELLEARSNKEHPAQQKLYGKNILNKYYDSPQADDYYVSFTKIDKVGINPLTTYNTPVGVYTYPLTYIMGFRSFEDLPFAGDSKFIQVITPTKHVLELKNYNNLKSDIAKAKHFLSTQGIEERDIDYILFQATSEAKPSVNSQASQFWNVARYLANEVSRSSSGTRIGKNGKELSKLAMPFNAVLRDIFNVHVVRDDGLGIIHENEPTQCLFLSKNSFTHVDSIPNRINSLDPKEFPVNYDYKKNPA